jgi:hypothetical protein
MSVLIEHIPHIVITVIMFIVALSLWLENVRSPPEEEGVEAVETWIAERDRYARRRVRPAVAGPALLLLVVIVAATGTGAWLYAINLASASRTAAIVIAHCVLGVAVLLVFLRKQRRTGKGRVMSAVRHGRMIDVASSTVSLSLLIPLTITGILAIFFPKASGISANLHFLIAAWWTILIVLHLRRYLLATVRTWRARRVALPAAPASTRAIAAEEPALVALSEQARR